MTERLFAPPHSHRFLPWYGWLGLLLVGIFWTASWTLPGPRTHFTFFPLWLGYILVVDALVLRRKGTSLLQRDVRAFVGLFIISAPVWWIFEFVNWRTQNWSYVGRDLFTDLEYALLASLSFSTVVPAVFSTAELAGTFGWIKRLRRGPVLSLGPQALAAFFAGGLLIFALMMAWPRYFFPFVWLWLYFLVAPLNVWLGHRSLADPLRQGDWRPVIALWTGVLICAFFWEFWNFYSFPKWVYHLPFADFAHVFEMPLLGYGGYLPFALELFALYHLVVGLLGGRLARYVQLI
ncbi:MAG: hypothetical protein ACE5H9_17785 [Anaerolineae bacterium]